MNTEPKKQAIDAAKKFFEKAKSQHDEVLAQRLGLSLPLSSAGKKAACFWFAAQKMVLLGQEYRTRNTTQAQGYYRGALDLLRRCEQALGESQELPAKVIGLRERCQHALSALMDKTTPVVSPISPEPQPAVRPEASDGKTLEAETLFNGELDAQRVGALVKGLSNPEAMKKYLPAFLAAQEKVLENKLQYLPDTKLMGILGFEGGDGLALPDPVREMLQHFVHLQTLFGTAQQVDDPSMQAVSIRMILRELDDMDPQSIDLYFVRNGAFVAIEILKRRAHEWIIDHQLQVDIEQPLQEALDEINRDLVKTCFALGYCQDSVQSKVALSLAGRGYFIGQGLLLAVQSDIKPDLFFNEAFEVSQVDYPVFAVMPSGYRLFVSMAGEDEIAQVGLNEELEKALKRHGWVAHEYFDVPRDRETLCLSQVEKSLDRLTQATQLEAANAAAQFAFLYLAELGLDWPDMFSKMAGVKSLLRRKNLKLVWHDEIPYWTLKLRTELHNPWQNKAFPRANQVVKLLKRFDV